MPILYPDNLQHNNSNKYLVDITEVRGNSYPIGTLSETGSIPVDKRKIGQLAFVSSSQTYYSYYGQTTSSVDWDNNLNWRILPSNSGSFTGSLQGTSTSASYVNTLDQDVRINGSLYVGNQYIMQPIEISYSGSYWPNLTASFLDINNVGIGTPNEYFATSDRISSGSALNTISLGYNPGIYNIGDVIDLLYFGVTFESGSGTRYDLFVNPGYYNTKFTITDITIIDLGVQEGVIYEFDKSFESIYYNIIGISNDNIGENSFISGVGNQTIYTGSAVFGYLNSSSANFQSVFGVASTPLPHEYAFVVGTGDNLNADKTYADIRRNSLEIYLTSSVDFYFPIYPIININGNTTFDLKDRMGYNPTYTKNYTYNIKNDNINIFHVSSSGIGIYKQNPNSELDILGDVIVSGSITITPTGSFTLPLSSSDISNRKTGSVYWDEPYLYIWNGSRFMSTSFS